MTASPLELDPRKNPSLWGAQSDPGPDETARIMAESALIAACFHTDWIPPHLRPGWVLRPRSRAGLN
jgi:hypothetical protein